MMRVGFGDLPGNQARWCRDGCRRSREAFSGVYCEFSISRSSENTGRTFDFVAAGERHPQRAVQRRIHGAGIERDAGRLDKLPRFGVKPVELLAAAAVEVRCAQEAPVVDAHQQRQIGLLLTKSRL